ncbi:unnamed protein product [Vitrella brassicaformis CCMP3155]|uniref:Uncharacterized protein n=2 Tax=Vitrella brassicaformis TaxID=1169539 RepID=A0A0G4FAT3_VITBC|nr:unnamed protein product [Vitrella brassicaformis CCMP3155]|eukprot:CEM10016.1 unnamed protein product [Vitrella brassicaformis CCMP3155]
MTDLLPIDVWHNALVPFLSVGELAALRSTSRESHISVVTADLLLKRIDARLEGNSLRGVIDIDREYGGNVAAGGYVAGLLAIFRRLAWCSRRLRGPSRLGYFLACARVLEQGGDGWRNIGAFIRLAVNYRLMADRTLPVVLSARWVAAHVRTKASRRLSLTETVYLSLIGHRVACRGDPLYRAIIGEYKEKLPPGDPYRKGYNQQNPVVIDDNKLFPSFTALMLYMLLQCWVARDPRSASRVVLSVHVDRSDSRMSDELTGEEGIAISYRLWKSRSYRRLVILSGFRPDDTIAAFVRVRFGSNIELCTTEPCAADASCPLDVRLPVSMRLFRRLLRRFGLEKEVNENMRVRV